MKPIALPSIRPLRLVLWSWVAMYLTLGVGHAFVTGPQSETFDATSADPVPWVVPPGVDEVTVEVWGGGGRGGTRSNNGRGGGGGGGAYSRTESQTVTPGQVLYLRPGLGSSTTSAGADSWVGTTNNVSSAFVLARGGNSAANNNNNGVSGGAAGTGIGTVRFSGGNGANQVAGGSGGGGGGGSSGGTAAHGNNGTGTTAGTAPTGGGAGGGGSTVDNVAGSPGGAPGGGGGGARRTSGTVQGGSGGDGRVVINYVLPPPSLELSGVPSTLLEGGVSQPITVRFVDAGGNPVTSATDTVITLSSTPAGGVFRNANDTAGITTLTIPAGQSEGSFRFVSSSIESYTLTVTADDLNSDSSQIDVIERPPLPPVAQIFYLPLPEGQVLQGLTTMATGLVAAQQPLNPVQRYAGITAVADGTIIFYDQMENGFEADINNPTNIYHAVTNPSGTQIWGDGDPSNGAPPGIPDDIINAGALIILSNPINTTTQPTEAAPLFNGGDKIVASKPIAITTSLWASQSQTLFCDAVEVFDTFSWGTDYRVPVGQNITLPGQSFEYVGASIMAGPGGATVEIDADANGTFETTVNLTEGQAHYINGGLQVGARIVASNRVQVDLITGDIGDNYESRWFRLLPTSLWTNSYFTPVSTPGTSRGRGDTSNTTGTETRVFLYNPNPSAITVTYSRRNLTGATANVANNGTSYSPTVILSGSAPGNVYGPIIELNNDGTATNPPEGAWIGIVNRSGSNSPSIESKVTNARNAGAAAVIIVRNTESTSFETAGTQTIPVVGMALSTGTALRNAGLGNGWVRVSGNQTTSTINVPAGGFANQMLDHGYGARFHTTGGQNFYAVSMTDANGTVASSNRAWDWGFSLLPESALTPQALIGLGFGRDPTSSVRPEENGSPIWVTTVGNPSGGNADVTVYVDYDSDPTTGPFTDPNGFKYDLALTMRQLESVKVYNPSGDQSRMLLYTLSEGVKVAVAWGQDTLQASAGQPGFDAGTGTPPLPQFVASKKSALILDVDNDGFISPGDHIEYDVEIVNVSRIPISDMTLQDILPDTVVYLPGTTTFTSHTAETVTLPDNVVGDPFPLSSEITLPVASLPPGEAWSVKYRVEVKPFGDLPPGTTSVVNSAIVNSLIVDTPANLLNEQPLFGKIGDRVWVDTNGNGVQDPDEPGLNGVTVNLLDADGNPVLDADLNPRTTTTVTHAGEPGFYQFVGVPAGTYILEFVTPSGYTFTIQNADSQGITGGANSDPSPSTGRTVPLTLAAGEVVNSVDAGIYEPGVISGTVRIDTTGNGEGDTPQSGVTVALLDGNGDPVLDGNGDPITTTTDGSGNYSFTDLPPGNYQVAQTVPGGFVAIDDADGDDFTIIGVINIVSGSNVTERDFVNQQPGSISGTVLIDTTGNGEGDTPQSGVLVALLDGSGDPVLDGNGDPVTTTTDGDGNYSFTNLPPGNYQVTQTVPGGYVAIDDADDGDFTVIGNVTPIGVAPGQNVTGQDFVNQQPGSIAGFVLEDLTNNNLGDYPIAGVTLTLKDGNGDDIDSDPETPGVQPTTTVTAADGSYSFGNLPPGSYMVVQTQPANYNSVSDVDGGDPDVIGDVTLIVVLPGQAVTDQNFIERHQLGSLSGRVMVDNTGDDEGNYPLGGVTITLVDAEGNPVDGDLLTPGIQLVTTETDEDGYYSFTGVRVGTLGTRMTPVSTHYNRLDIDGEDPAWIGDVTGIVVLEDADTQGNDYLLRRLACPNTWESWLERWDLEDPTPLGNEDGDLYSNLLEYAFCMDPTDGVGGAWCPDYVLETAGPGEFVIKVNGNFGRTGAGPTDVIFELQYTDTLGPDTTWTTIPMPEPDGETVVLDSDFETGREVLEMVDLVGLTGLTDGRGFIRLKVTLDTNGNGIADPEEPSDVTDVGGWIITPMTPNIRTFNDPFVSCPVYSGTVASVDGFDLHLVAPESAGRDLSGDINYPAYHYYAEVLDGEFEGHRFDVVGGGETFLTVANDTNIFSGTPPHSTYAGAPPAGLAGARIVVRQYRTIDELFQTNTLVTQQPEDATWVDPALSPVVQMNRGGQWVSQWLLRNQNDVAWVDVGDEDLNDTGNMPMPPGQGAFIQARFTGVLVLLGKVRENDFRRPLQAGLNNVGSGYPLVESAAGRWMTRTQNGFRASNDFQLADAFMMWRGDTQPGVHVYDNYFFANRIVDNPSYLRWVRSGDAMQARRENELLFRPDYSILIRHNVGGAEPLNLPDYRWPAPWNP